jgi:branched-chain amino acid transport system permease protein
MQRPMLYLIFAAALVAAPWLGCYPVFMTKLLCLALFACAFNLLLGYTGLLSFGHAAFFGGAGYVAGYALRNLGLTPELAILASVAAGGVLGLAFGLLAIRRAGIYFAMITLALAQMVYFVCVEAPVTGGEDGLQGVPRGRLFGLLPLGNDTVLYYVVLIVCVLAFLFIMRVVKSPFGQVLRAIKENEPRAISLGYDVDRFKLIAFVLSALLSALAGALQTLALGFETLSDVYWTMSGMVILMTLVGGLGTFFGPVLGAMLVVVLENRLGDIGNGLAAITGIAWFQSLGESVTIVIGLIFVVCVLAFRRGVVGEVERFFAARSRRARAAGRLGARRPAA